MDNKLYIILGLCVFAFLVGSRLKKKLTPQKKEVHIPKNQRSKRAKEAKTPQKAPLKQKMKSIFLWVQVVVIFALILFMIPALTRDIQVADGNYTTNLILRILIVALAVWTLFLGVSKLLKSKSKKS